MKITDHLRPSLRQKATPARLALLMLLNGCAATATDSRADAGADSSTADSTDTGPSCHLRSIRVQSTPGYQCDENGCNSIINLGVQDSMHPTLEVDAPYCLGEGANYGVETQPGSGRYLVPMEITCIPNDAPILRVTATGRLAPDSLGATEVFKHENVFGAAVARTWPAGYINDRVPCTFTSLGRSVSGNLRVNLQPVESTGTPSAEIIGDQLIIRFNSTSAGKYTVFLRSTTNVDAFPVVPREMTQCRGDIAGALNQQTCEGSLECSASINLRGALECHNETQVHTMRAGANSTNIPMPVSPTSPPTPYYLDIVGINDGYNTGTMMSTLISY